MERHDRDFTEIEKEDFWVFDRHHKLSDEESECFVELKLCGMSFANCGKTILEARAKAHAEPEPAPEPEPEPEPVEEEVHE